MSKEMHKYLLLIALIFCIGCPQQPYDACIACIPDYDAGPYDAKMDHNMTIVPEYEDSSGTDDLLLMLLMFYMLRGF